MKLRIRGNFIRLRLQKSEVNKLATSGRVEDRTVFGPDEFLVYAIEKQVDDEIALIRAPGEITVLLPGDLVDEWAESDQVGFETVADNGAGGLTILVEKDFSCLIEREGEDESDAYRNPSADN